MRRASGYLHPPQLPVRSESFAPVVQWPGHRPVEAAIRVRVPVGACGPPRSSAPALRGGPRSKFSPVRLTVRTPGFQPGNEGSTPSRGTAALPAQRCLTGVKGSVLMGRREGRDRLRHRPSPGGWRNKEGAPGYSVTSPGAPHEMKGTLLERCGSCLRIMVPNWLVKLWPTRSTPFYDRLNCAGHCLRCMKEAEEGFGGT